MVALQFGLDRTMVQSGRHLIGTRALRPLGAHWFQTTRTMATRWADPLPEPQALDSMRARGYPEGDMNAMAARHRYWFAYYFSPPALLVGREVLSG